jgi:hypothetical protein
MRVEIFQPYHVDLLRAQGVQGAQLNEVSLVPGACANVPPGPAVSAFDGDRILICGGIAKITNTNGVCWALVAEGAGKHMHALHFAVKRFITLQPWRRLEASVEEGFGAGCRWVELLGFQFEGRMLKYGENGANYLRYAKVT